ncbi:MAG: glutathione transferase [Kofleriaceae bacterium]|nr:glutathione transferase [Kofleriaceae bacterium]
MSVSDLTLYVGSTWDSPWSFHAMVAIEEKQLPYKLEVVQMPIAPEVGAQLTAKALQPRIPVLVHDGHWISESLAISEYLAERFPFPDYPRLFPADLVERARARQVMSWARTTMRGLREDRPTSNVFGRANVKPMSAKGKADADELLYVAGALIAPGKTQMFSDWSIADADMALFLMRMIAANDPIPKHLVDYAHAQWDRRSVKRFLAHVPTSK